MTLGMLHDSDIYCDVTIGRAGCEAYSATWNSCSNLESALRPRNTTENLDRVGRSQNFRMQTDFQPAFLR
jgi:hypothetical protein